MRSDPATTSRPATDHPTVVVVGAGAAGTLTALHLLRRLRHDRTAADLVLVDPALVEPALVEPALVDPAVVDPAVVDRGAGAGRGVAYGTTDRRHLLNVPAARLSARPDEPHDFLDWARCHVDPDAAPHDFLPRADYGRYLAECLAVEADRPSTARLRRVARRVVALERGERDQLRLDDGTVLAADQVVLAPGVLPPGTGWAPRELLLSDRFVADPWAPGVLDRLRDADGDVLLVGTGLTSVDVALTLHRPGRRLHAVSRRGRLPTVHGRPRPAVPPPVLPEGLDALRAAIGDHLAATVRATGDWRPALDGLRPHTQRLWAALTPDERRAFLDHDAARWDTHRHRMPRASAAAIGRLRAEGALRLHRGTVAGVHDDGAALVVRLSCGTSVRVAAVVNGTGPLGDVSLAGDPLLTGLLADGLAVPGPCDLGIATDADGRVRAGSGETGPRWAIGALRRGDLWESTAIPEIRAQAVALADHLGRALAPRGPVRRRPCDVMGLPLSTHAEAAAAYNDGLGRVLRVQSGAEEALRAAVALDPDFALAHAALALLGHEGGAGTDVAASLAAARAAVRRRGDERERSLVEVVGTRVQDCRGLGAAALVRHIGAHPRDALAVSAAVPTIAFSGVTDVQQEAWALVEGLAPAYGAHWWYAGLLAFVRQDQGRYDEAHALAGRALAVEPASGHAVHAQTHVYYETGQHETGLAWLDPWIATSGRAASHRAHFSWHAALHELSLGDLTALHRRWDGELAPPHVTGVRALVDSASLLWRCRITGSWSGDLPLPGVLDSLLESVGRDLLERPDTPFTAMHAALALTAAADVDGLVRLRAHALGSPDVVMSDIVVSLCDALLAVVEARWSEAVRILRLLGPWLVQLGGSAAQREIVEDTLLHALVSAGRCDEARLLLEGRLDRRPSPLDVLRLDRVPA